MKVLRPPLVSTDWLAAHLNGPGLRLIDSRWRLGQPHAGRALYEESRIPGAAFLDIEQDMSDIGQPQRGRHPLPDPERLVESLAAADIGKGDFVIAYDDAGGMHAARVVWLVRWLGGEAAVLDGGITQWTDEGRQLEEGSPRIFSGSKKPLAPEVDSTMVVDKGLVRKLVKSGLGALTLLDARAPERYRGEVEPIDPKAGHIPGAKSAPATENLAHGRFLPAAELRAKFERLGIKRGEDVIAYCGSGVTACHDLLALELAGFPGAKLYAGSWSEWSHDEEAPVATGEDS